MSSPLSKEVSSRSITSDRWNFSSSIRLGTTRLRVTYATTIRKRTSISLAMLRRRLSNRRSCTSFDLFARLHRSLTNTSQQHTKNLFQSVYPWAGQDRSTTAPTIAIVKAGYKTLFAHPADVQRAAEHALHLGQDRNYLRGHPGEVFGYLAHAHPFLEGNGRTILTIFAELSRRAGFHIQWEAMDKTEFLETLTRELLQPGKATMDQFVLPFLQEGVLSVESTASRLRVNFKGPPSAS